MDDQLDTIHNDLGCNAIRINGGGTGEDNIIECARLAIDKGFEKIFVNPRYMSKPVSETIEKTVEFSKRVKELRETSSAIVYMFGSEYSTEQSGIISGGSWAQRAGNLAGQWNAGQSKLRMMFNELLPKLTKNYEYELTYASGAWEVDVVPWSHPSIKYVCTNGYIQEFTNWTEEWVKGLLSKLKSYGKPVHSSEFGCFAYPGAGYYGGAGVWHSSGLPEDQQEQASYAMRYFKKILAQVKIDGCHWVHYEDPYPQSMGIINGNRRRLVYYVLKSFKV